MKPTYTKLILQDGKLVTVADDYAEKHELVLVQHPMLAHPLVVAAYTTPDELEWKNAIAAAEKLVICDRPMRAPTVEEAFMFCDRTQYPALPVQFFPDAEDNRWTWTSTVDAEDPAGDAWLVDLTGGNADRYYRYYDFLVRAVCAGQFSDLGVVLP